MEESTWLSTLKEEFRKNWFKVLCLIVVCVCMYHTVDDIRSWLKAKNAPQTITVNTPAPQYITPKGTITTQQPPMIVTIPQVSEEQTTVGVKQKSDPKTGADVVYDESNNKYLFEYNGGFGSKTFEIKPDIKEDYKFQNGQMVINRTVTQKTSVSVPTPIGGFGLGISGDKRPVVSYSTRLGKTSANVQLLTDGRAKGTYLVFTNTIYK